MAHGGSVLDLDMEASVRRADVATFRGALVSQRPLMLRLPYRSSDLINAGIRDARPLPRPVRPRVRPVRPLSGCLHRGPGRAFQPQSLQVRHELISAFLWKLAIAHD